MVNGGAVQLTYAICKEDDMNEPMLKKMPPRWNDLANLDDGINPNPQAKIWLVLLVGGPTVLAIITFCVKILM